MNKQFTRAILAIGLFCTGSASAQTGAVFFNGSELKPGELPAGTEPAARESWERLCRAMLPQGASTLPVRAFDLSFDGRARPNAAQSNDFDKARYRFLFPDWVRTTLRSGRERVHGPAGDYLIADREVLRLTGREYAEDLRELEETLGMSRNFVALTDLSKLRLARLERQTKPSAGMPKIHAPRAEELDWLKLLSPDFRTAVQPRSQPAAINEKGTVKPVESMFRVHLGLNRQTNLPELVVIQEETQSPGLAEAAMLLILDDFRSLQGFQVPHRVAIHPIENGVFRDQPTLELWLLPGGNLRPELSPADFLPPA